MPLIAMYLRNTVLLLVIFLFYTVSSSNTETYGKQLENVLNDLIKGLNRRAFQSSQQEEWTGKWFPESRNTPKVENQAMWSMINSSCDDGKTNLTVDWSGSYENYTCLNPDRWFLPDPDIPALIVQDSIPATYHARHVCMSSEIMYDSYLPTFGPHRPAWPRYGEYVFLPKQRWLHSLEHGAVVMLYHPCAHPFLVAELKQMVRACLYRHIITPYNLLPSDRPFALVTWGWSLLMSDIDLNMVGDFIKEHALNGPEKTSADGQYDYMLIKPAKIVSTKNDDILACPLS